MANAKVADDRLQPVVIKFGGGINTRELPVDLEDRECANGSQNFGLDLFSAALFPRAPFDQVGTAPNGGSINGFAQLEKVDGTLSTLIQAGSTVYAWDGTPSGFTSVGSVPSSSKLRGDYRANFPLLNKVLITDLTLQQPVSTWDGTTFANLPTNLGATFYAKYCIVDLERAWFANVTAGAATPHLIVASKVDDPTNLTTANKPSSAIGAGDPFFVATQDLSPINGFVQFAQNRYVSTKRGSLFTIEGDSSQNMQIASTYPFIGALGDEAMVYIGNDVAYGRNGRVETLFGTINYGDVETQELTRHIADQIKGVTGWLLLYDPQLYRLYCFPQGTVDASDLWVYYKSITDDWVNRLYRKDGLPIRSSPWSRWKTVHSMGFQPSSGWMMKRPSDGSLGVYLGDSSGNLYRLDGTGTGDGGSASITTTRTSKMYQLPQGDFYDVSGHISYQRQLGSASVQITFQNNGESIFDSGATIVLDGASGGSYFGGGAYYGGGAYFNVNGLNRVATKQTGQPATGSQFQVVATVTGTANFEINDITIRLKAKQ